MNEVIFVCDESGPTGFADKSGRSPKEIGLLGGVILPKCVETTVRERMAAIAAACPPSRDGKLHVAGLDGAAAETLRKKVFRLINDEKLTCVYSATAVDGFHATFQRLHALEAAAAGAKPAYIVDKNPRLRPDRLHAELFQGAFGTVVAWCEEQFGQNAETSIEVRMDQVEETILKELSAAAAELIKGPSGQTQALEFYDKAGKKPVNAKIELGFTGAEAFGPLAHIKYTLEVADLAFALLADVIANSLHDHIQKKFAAGLVDELHGTDAVAGHRLAGAIFGYNTVAGIPRLSDVVHRHPSLSLKTKTNVNAGP